MKIAVYEEWFIYICGVHIMRPRCKIQISFTQRVRCEFSKKCSFTSSTFCVQIAILLPPLDPPRGCCQTETRRSCNCTGRHALQPQTNYSLSLGQSNRAEFASHFHGIPVRKKKKKNADLYNDENNYEV